MSPPLHVNVRDQVIVNIHCYVSIATCIQVLCHLEISYVGLVPENHKPPEVVGNVQGVDKMMETLRN
jgi:hypothetical protein